MADVSPWAFTPDFAFAAKMVTLNMMVFSGGGARAILDVSAGTSRLQWGKKRWPRKIRRCWRRRRRRKRLNIRKG